MSSTPEKPTRSRCSEVSVGSVALDGRPVLIAALMFAAACSPVRHGATPRQLGNEVPAYQAPSQPQTRGPVGELVEPTGEVTLRDVLAQALLGNPELQASSWEERATEAARLQAGLVPNPTLDAESEDLVGSGAFSPKVSQPQTTMRLSQLVELGGDRAARQRIAAATADLAGWEYEARRLDVLTRTAQAFVDVLGQQAAVRLVEDDLRLSQQMADVVGERVAAGVVSPVEETKARVAVAAARVTLEAAQRALEAGRRILALQWGSDRARFTKAAGEFPPIGKIPALDVLENRLEQNPDLARWDAELSRRQAQVDLERARAIPDVTLSAGYRRFHDTDSSALVVGAAVPLPLFDRNQGALGAARYRLEAGTRDRRAAEGRVSRALAEAYRALSTARAEALALQSAVLPGAESAYAAVLEGYGLGKFGLLDVLDAQRTLFGARAQNLRALTNFHKATAEVERLVGESLETLR